MYLILTMPARRQIHGNLNELKWKLSSFQVELSDLVKTNKLKRSEED